MLIAADSFHIEAPILLEQCFIGLTLVRSAAGDMPKLIIHIYYNRVAVNTNSQENSLVSLEGFKSYLLSREPWGEPIL